jgi:serine/threonine protein phosphatase PrpC
VSAGESSRARSDCGGIDLPNEPSESSAALRTASLCGSSSHVIGGVSTIAEGRAAIALSQGGAKKRYPHTDPNEDAAGFALGEPGALLVVADGHSGREAAEVAVGELLRRAVALFSDSAEVTRAQWATTALEMLAAVHAAILARVASGGRDTARTTLAMALVRPDDDLLAFASAGDSHIFRVGPSEVVDLACDSERRGRYLGNPAADLGSLRDDCVIGTETLPGVRAVALATDGISESGIGVDLPEFTIGECADVAEKAKPDLRPLEFARSVTEAALAAHRSHRSGDNIATAVTWLPHVE